MALLTGKADPTLNIPQRNSGSEEWIAWYEVLKSNFGKKNANTLWVKAWARRGSDEANTKNLRDYMSKRGINIEEGAWDKVVDVAGGVGDFFGDVIQGGKITAIVLGVIVLGGLGLMVYNIARRPGETAGTVIKYAK